MSAHTPGPWKVMEHSWSHTGVIAGDDCICALDICHATEDTQDALEVVMAANATLIAAAPDLLEALFAIAGDADGQHADPLRTLQNVRDTARAAIAKATGAAQ